MAETIDLDEWELINSPNSSSKDVSDERDGVLFDYFGTDLHKDNSIITIELKEKENLISLNLNESNGIIDSKEICFQESCKEMEERESQIEIERPITGLGFQQNKGLDDNTLSNQIIELNQIDDVAVNSERNFPNLVEDTKEKYCSFDSEKVESTGHELVFDEIEDFHVGELDNIDNKMLNSDKNCPGELEEIKENGVRKELGMEENEKQIISKIGAEEKKEFVWWKKPMDVIKCCVFNAKPVWSVSIAMGVLGFIIIGRKYYFYKMKTKDKSIPPMKVHFHDKRTTQLNSQAARLNKALTIVRPEPIIRTPVPAFGVTPFPAMSIQ